MAGYDPKRPRPAAGGGDDPAPVEALIDLAEHRSPDVPPRQDPASSGASAGGSALRGSAASLQETPVGSGAADPTSAQQAASSWVAPRVPIAGRRSRLVWAGALAGCAAVLVVLVLRRRRS